MDQMSVLHCLGLRVYICIHYIKVYFLTCQQAFAFGIGFVFAEALFWAINQRALMKHNSVVKLSTRLSLIDFIFVIAVN